MGLTVVDLDGRADRRRPALTSTEPRRKRLLYEDVIDLVARIVDERQLAPGDQLPTHAELAKLAGVSMITVRRALEELERRGQVRRHQGLGTFLARPRIVSEPGRTGGLRDTFSPDRSSQDARRIGSTLLGIDRCLPSPDLADAMRIGPDEPLWRLSRLRHIDGTPMIVEASTIPVHRAPDLQVRGDALRGSLYQLLESEYGIVDDYEEHYLDVRAPSAQERALLHLPARAQVVRIRGLSVDTAGTPFDWFEQVYPAADFTFAFAGSTARRLVQGPDGRELTVRPAVGPAGGSGRGRRR
jgi:GntR family transcriptional regulator